MNENNIEYSCSVCNKVVNKFDIVCPNCGADLTEEIYPDSQLRNNYSIIKNYLSKHKIYLLISLGLIIFLLTYLYRYKIIALTLGEFKQVLPRSVLGTGYSNVGINTFKDSIYSISCGASSLIEQKFIKWDGDTVSNQSIACGTKFVFDIGKELYGYDSSVLIIKLDSSNAKKFVKTRIYPQRVGITKIYFNFDGKNDTIKVKITKRNKKLVIEESI